MWNCSLFWYHMCCASTTDKDKEKFKNLLLSSKPTFRFIIEFWLSFKWPLRVWQLSQLKNNNTLCPFPIVFTSFLPSFKSFHPAKILPKKNHINSVKILFPLAMIFVMLNSAYISEKYHPQFILHLHFLSTHTKQHDSNLTSYINISKKCIYDENAEEPTKRQQQKIDFLSLSVGSIKFYCKQYFPVVVVIVCIWKWKQKLDISIWWYFLQCVCIYARSNNARICRFER